MRPLSAALSWHPAEWKTRARSGETRGPRYRNNHPPPKKKRLQQGISEVSACLVASLFLCLVDLFICLSVRLSDSLSCSRLSVCLVCLSCPSACLSVSLPCLACLPLRFSRLYRCPDAGLTIQSLAGGPT